MTSYRVTWEIDIEADTPVEAAKIALSYQRDPESTSTVFEVFESDADSGPVKIDLTAIEEEEITALLEAVTPTINKPGL
jgi:hypothetical protein